MKEFPLKASVFSRNWEMRSSVEIHKFRKGEMVMRNLSSVGIVIVGSGKRCLLPGLWEGGSVHCR